MEKKRTMNELRQTKEYTRPSKSFIADQEAAKKMAEGENIPRFTTKNHLNEVHNKLWGENYYKADEYDGDIHQENLDKAAAEGSTKYWPKENKHEISEASKYYNKTMNPSKYTENDLEQARCSIVEKITKHFDDKLFEMVCEEMSKNYLFQSQNYLTEAGYDIFEDEWFEFYHEHHGEILFQVINNITN